jgi:serine/threonine protein phosphatase PrpC
VVASDGVWEYMTNEEVMEIMIPFYHRDNPDQAAEKLVLEAANSWRRVITH